MTGELTREEQSIVDAWLIPGRNPVYHRSEKERLRRYWPVLYAAIEKVVNKAAPTTKVATDA